MVQIPIPPKKDYDEVRKAIADILEKDDYDDGVNCSSYWYTMLESTQRVSPCAR